MLPISSQLHRDFRPLSPGITTWTYIVGFAMASIVIVPFLLLFFRRKPVSAVKQADPHRRGSKGLTLWSLV